MRLVANRTKASQATHGARARASAATMRAEHARERAVEARRVLAWQDQQALRRRWP